MTKKNKKLQNPFVYEGYEGDSCNTTLVSPRKIGKTGLILHTFNRIKQENKDAVCIDTDIFHTQNQIAK